MNALHAAVVVAEVVVDVTEKIVQPLQVQKLKSQMHNVNQNHHASLRNLESRMKIAVSVHNVVSAKIAMHLQLKKHC
jgi:p-aminobenzoyl-glutamate transporter AbgT